MKLIKSSSKLGSTVKVSEQPSTKKNSTSKQSKSKNNLGLLDECIDSANTHEIEAKNDQNLKTNDHNPSKKVSYFIKNEQS